MKKRNMVRIASDERLASKKDRQKKGKGGSIRCRLESVKERKKVGSKVNEGERPKNGDKKARLARFEGKETPSV